MMHFCYQSKIYAASQKGGAYVLFPGDIRALFGKGRCRVVTYYEDQRYEGSIVNMGVKKEDGSIQYVIGIPKAIRTILQKDIGNDVNIEIEIL
ncbi:hypothetical protein BN3662_02787 [Clostridiales bacterium CHKCI006]|nr:hypothetical protein BN3662_02787 [Clostridiales bacterium CHKCI006]